MSQSQYAILAQFLLYLGAIIPFQSTAQIVASIPRNGASRRSQGGHLKSLRPGAITIFTIAMATSSMATQSRPNGGPVVGVPMGGRQMPSTTRSQSLPLVQHRYKAHHSPQTSNTTTTSKVATNGFDTKKNEVDSIMKTILAMSGEEEGREDENNTNKTSNNNKIIGSKTGTKPITTTIGKKVPRDNSNGAEIEYELNPTQTSIKGVKKSGNNKKSKTNNAITTSNRNNNGNTSTGIQGAQTSEEQSITTMLRCQDLGTRQLIPAATTCKNSRSDRVCSYLFVEVDVKTGKRDIKCNLQGLEDIAESCRRTCGICCEDINYSCEDDYNGIIDCSKQLNKCHINKWFGVLSRFCAGSCGLCARTACRDYDNTCRVRKALCLKEETMDYMRENCARTCGFCIVGDLSERAGELLSETASTNTPGDGDIDPTPTIANMVAKKSMQQNGKMSRILERPTKMAPMNMNNNYGELISLGFECSDRDNNCTTNENLCSSPIYSEYMLKFCTKTCLKCAQPHSAPTIHVESVAPAPTHRFYQSKPRWVDSFVAAPPPSTRNDEDIMKMMNMMDEERLQFREPPPIAHLTPELSIAGVDQINGRPLIGTNVLAPLPSIKQQSNSNNNFGGTNSASSPNRMGRSCLDRHHKCGLWTQNGLCTKERFKEQRYRLCLKSCNLC